MQSFFRTHPKLSGLVRSVGLLTLVLVLSQCTSTVKKADVVVSVKEQKLGLYEEGQLKKTYDISTSKFGLGDRPGSNCTPLGQHQVVAKIGHGLPAGAVLKSRHWNGEVIKPNAPGRDPIVSRILWLRGTEKANSHAYGRFIYIHGTPEERRLGEPASYGCVRMGMKDVVTVFNAVNVGAKVLITKDSLPKGEKPKVDIDDGSPSTTTPIATDDKALPIQLAKLDVNAKEKANAEKNEKAGPEKPEMKEKTTPKSSSSKTKTAEKASPEKTTTPKKSATASKSSTPAKKPSSTKKTSSGPTLTKQKTSSTQNHAA